LGSFSLRAENSSFTSCSPPSPLFREGLLGNKHRRLFLPSKSGVLPLERKRPDVSRQPPFSSPLPGTLIQENFFSPVPGDDSRSLGCGISFSLLSETDQKPFFFFWIFVAVSGRAPVFVAIFSFFAEQAGQLSFYGCFLGIKDKVFSSPVEFRGFPAT